MRNPSLTWSLEPVYAKIDMPSTMAGGSHGGHHDAGAGSSLTDQQRFSWDKVLNVLSRQRVLIVGGAGFIGYRVASSLAEAGAVVHVVDNLMVNNVVDHFYNRNTSPIQYMLYQNFLIHRIETMRRAGVLLHNVDARDYGALIDVFQKCRPTKVIHMAAISSALSAKAVPGHAFDLQLNTLRNTLEIVRLASERPEQVMFMSSSTVYGNFSSPAVDETTTLVPQGIYANAKYMGERLLRTYRDQYDVGCTIIRPSALYGMWCISRRVSQVFIENALAGLPLTLEGGGEGMLDFTDVDDLVQGMLRALAFYTYRSDTFNLTYGSARPVRDLVSIIRDLIPSAVVEERERSLDRPVRGTLSIDKARERIGFDPQLSLDKGYRRFCEHYMEQWERARRMTANSGNA